MDSAHDVNQYFTAMSEGNFAEAKQQVATLEEAT
jgi:hypothetical protein